jgi:hypothetical protein
MDTEGIEWGGRSGGVGKIMLCGNTFVSMVVYFLPLECLACFHKARIKLL